MNRLEKLEEEVEMIKFRLDASTELQGSILTQLGELKVIVNCLIDPETLKQITENIPEISDPFRNVDRIKRKLETGKVK